MAHRSEALSLSEEARAFSRDEHESRLLEQFFSWPPPAPRAADLTLEPFERAPLPRGTRRAIWASSLMLFLSIALIGGYFVYHNYVMPAPAALGDWSDTDTLPLPTPILAEDVAHADPEPRSVYQASLQHDVSAIKQAEPVADGAGAAKPVGAPTAELAAQAAPAGEASPAPAEPEAAAPTARDEKADRAGEARPAPAPAATEAAAPTARAEKADGAPTPAASANAEQAVQAQAAAVRREATGESAAIEPSAQGPALDANHPQAAGAAQLPSSAPQVQGTTPKPEAAPSFYAQLALAQQQLAQGELRQSLPTFESALALRAHSVDALLGKATALFGLKEYDAAKSSAQLAVAIDPRSHEAFALIGGSLEWLGQRAEAKAIYERCVEEAVDSTVCRERLAQLTSGQ